jgi:lipid-A-disaccharide synthase
VAKTVLVSAGEASGDVYAAALVAELRKRDPDCHFFGCAQPRMKAEGVEAAMDASRLHVVGLVEVLRHLPGIWREYQKLLRATADRRPDFALLVDSPDFHLRLARKLRKQNVPVFYFVAPQAWAWRKSRVYTIRRNVNRLLCIFPFEEQFYRRFGVDCTFVGHPMTRLVRSTTDRQSFFHRHGLTETQPLVALLPGSRPGEIRRHLPDLTALVALTAQRRQLQFVLGAAPEREAAFYWQHGLPESVRIVTNDTWNLIAHADVAMAASGTVATETALLGTPMVTYYRVAPMTWHLGRRLVKIPWFTMVNLVTNTGTVPELIQDQLSGAALHREMTSLLDDATRREKMKQGLLGFRRQLETSQDPIHFAVNQIEEYLKYVQNPSSR